MKTVRKYIFREIVGPFSLGLLVFSFVLLIGIIGQPTSRNPLHLLVQQNVSLSETLLIFAYLGPRILTLSLPMATLLGILIGLGRLSADSEITAMRASGISARNLMHPVFAFALIAWGVAFMNSAFWYPKSLERIRFLANDVARRSINTEVREGVFEEGFSNLVLFVKKISIDKNSWSNIFLADASKPNQLKITLASSGSLISDPAQNALQLHLAGGAHHIVENQSPSVYQVMPFDRIEIPVSSGTLTDINTPKKVPLEERRLVDLWTPPPGSPLSAKEKRDQQVELNVRLALPFSVLIFSLLGIPMGVLSKRGGKSYGFVISLVIFIVYYLFFLQGNNFAKSGRLPPYLGPWMANLFFLAAGTYLMVRTDQLSQFPPRFQRMIDHLSAIAHSFFEKGASLRQLNGKAPWSWGTQKLRLALPLILDRYIIKGVVRYFLLVLMAFISVFIIFTFFELLNDIVENRISYAIVTDYFLYLMPQILFYMFPLSLLVAILVNFNILTRTSQITAIKASGVSLYRLSLSVVFIALFLCAFSFMLQESILPTCNQKQDALRAVIKGKPPRTHTHPGRKWIVGEQSKIINYNFFDEDQNLFGEISVFEFEPVSFQLRRRIYATRAEWNSQQKEWIFLEGWSQGFKDQHTIPESFHAFARAKFQNMTEPPDYFKKEVKLDSQMNFRELSTYAGDMKKSGFDVTKLEVALQKKLSFPVVNLIMCLLAIPFSFSSGRHGSLYGVGLSILVGIVYWVMVGFFEQMGGVGKLMPVLAAWAPNLIFGAAGIYMIFTVET
jgi:LPS export ABC transporter permease LptG/LPS export ABC transporter permease LptF